MSQVKLYLYLLSGHRTRLEQSIVLSLSLPSIRACRVLVVGATYHSWALYKWTKPQCINCRVILPLVGSIRHAASSLPLYLPLSLSLHLWSTSLRVTSRLTTWWTLTACPSILDARSKPQPGWYSFASHVISCARRCASRRVVQRPCRMSAHNSKIYRVLALNILHSRLFTRSPTKQFRTKDGCIHIKFSGNFFYNNALDSWTYKL